GAIVLSVIWVTFFLAQRNTPEDVALPAIDDPGTAVDESKVPDVDKLSRDAWINLFVVAGFYFCAKFVRYALWSWAEYFLHNKYGLDHDQAAFYSLMFDVCGLFGVIATGFMSDKYFGGRRGGISLIMMLGMMAATGLLMAFGATSLPLFV